MSLITEQLLFTHHILLFVSSKKEGVLEMREKPRIRYYVTDTQPASTFPAAVCKLKISSFLFPEADGSLFTLLGVIDVTIHSPSLIFLLPFSFFSSCSSLSPPPPCHPQNSRQSDEAPLLNMFPLLRFKSRDLHCLLCLVLNEA